MAANNAKNRAPGGPVQKQAASAVTSGPAQRNGSPHAEDPGDTRARAPGGYHGTWLTVGGLALPGVYERTAQSPVPENYANLANQSTMTGLEYAMWASRDAFSWPAYAAGMTLGAGVGMGLGVDDMVKTGQKMGANPDSEQAKWDFANASVHTLANGVAMALAPLSPAVAFVPLMLPEVGDAYRAWGLANQQNALQQEGKDTEAAAVQQSHTLASLNATPVINWFAPFYEKALTPAIEKFEIAHGNCGGQPAPSELPPGTATNPVVVDYYGNAMNERAQWLAGNMLPFMQQRFNEEKARSPDTDTVTIVARWPQTFNWPSSVPAQPMRKFDRAIALTYSEKAGNVVATYFGRDVDGTYRLPPSNHDIALRPDARHRIFYSQMFTPGQSTPVFPDHDSPMVRQS
ncbi:hypothetical protein [Paraburkholderia rhizosphaerae]|uniref:hypothetical protein n=1 Tax=Paraburkholderia rhizosphaerae TaxID=480658 RepID=UPI001417013E|nr:hypothetical protein [Paraburkholderia rhizosphaerae]